MGIDSGAAVTILPRDKCTDYPLMETSGSHPNYKAANGDTIYDEGARTVFFAAGDRTRALRARVGKVSKGLISVAEMVDCGHMVVFDGDESYAIHKGTGAKTIFRRRNKVFEVDLDVLPYAQVPADSKRASTRHPNGRGHGRQ